MDKEELIQITNKVYKTTLLFPKKEPLRYKIREIADDILSNFVYRQSLQDINPGNFAFNRENQNKDSIFLLEKNLEILKSYFEVAKWQNWVSYFDILGIQDRYAKIQDGLKKEIQKIEEKKRDLLEENIIQTNDRAQSIEREINKEPKKDLASDVILSKKEEIKLDPRKTKILNFLRKTEKTQVQDIKKILPNVSKRTIRRDFVQLLDQRLVKKIGDKNNTFYQLIA
jgi:DNA-binding transcriptional ArsR family regulator